MREIKFRLRKGNKIVGYERWFPGNEHFLPGWEYAFHQKGIWTHFRDGGYIEHDAKDEFTGLPDKNGREIYEGDIVKWLSLILPITVEDFHGYRFMFGKDQLCKAYAVDGEIIGNIHESPSLLPG